MEKDPVRKDGAEMIISENISELVTALAKAQGAIENAAKSSLNIHFKSAYATLSDIREATREPLATNGLSIVQGLRTVQGAIEVETILFHNSGQSIRETLAVPLGRPDPQSMGSAATYGRKYALMAMLGLAAEDDDGNAATAAANGKGAAPSVTGPISPAQAEEIKMDIIHSGADLPRFLRTFGIEKIEEMPAARFAEAKHKLELKLQQTLRDEGSDA
jgi:ERF superfamily